MAYSDAILLRDGWDAVAIIKLKIMRVLVCVI